MSRVPEGSAQCQQDHMGSALTQTSSTPTPRDGCHSEAQATTDAHGHANRRSAEGGRAVSPRPSPLSGNGRLARWVRVAFLGDPYMRVCNFGTSPSTRNREVRAWYTATWTGSESLL